MNSKGYKNFCIADDIASMCSYYHPDGRAKRPDGPDCEYFTIGMRAEYDKCPMLFENFMCTSIKAIDAARKK